MAVFLFLLALLWTTTVEAQIASSSIISNSPQKDGRAWIVEKHTDTIGIVYLITYIADNTVNLTNHLAGDATNLGNQLVANEIAADILGVATYGHTFVPTFNYATTTQVITAFRAAYLVETETQVIFTGDYLNNVPLAGIEQAFGVNATQAQNLLTNVFAPQAVQAAAIVAARGQ